jgi:arginyl-tRNA--protein-N-Asp/Glu arginylyltransferase
MLKFHAEHFYASQENYGMELARLVLDTTDLDEREALEGGWLLDASKWYQCRSVRIDLSKFRSHDKLPSSFSVELCKDCTLEIMEIYETYLKHKQFRHTEYPFYARDRALFLVVRDQDIPCAFSRFTNYVGGIESAFTAWDYKKPQLSIGKRIIPYEVDYAQKLGYSHLYIGEGCEIGSLYKAEITGFEWWTGSEWSTDKDQYKKLCISDSNTKTLADLSTLFNSG